MDSLNYHHLHYFAVVAREGSIVAAARKLGIAQPTISSQIRQLEVSLGALLFERVGRGLVLTEVGRMTQKYADEIFGLGRELQQIIQGQQVDKSQTRVVIGIADVVPKLIVHPLVQAVFATGDDVRVTCIEGRPESLLAELAQHSIDIVISDAPIPATVRVRAYNHVLGESEVSLCGAPQLARRYRRGFPASLDGAPLLLPTRNAVLRRSIEDWIDAQGIQPTVRGEFDDSALTKVVGQSGAGLFFVPKTIEREVKKQYGVERVGVLEGVRERFYAISVERRFKNPALVKLTKKAKSMLSRG